MVSARGFVAVLAVLLAVAASVHATDPAHSARRHVAFKARFAEVGTPLADIKAAGTPQAKAAAILAMMNTKETVTTTDTQNLAGDPKDQKPSKETGDLTAYTAEESKAIKDAIVALNNADLITFKTEMDKNNVGAITHNRFSFYWLLYTHLKDHAADVTAIEAHITATNAAAAGEPWRIYGDIDDTLFAYKNLMWPKNEYIPGAGAVWAAIVKGAGATVTAADPLKRTHLITGRVSEFNNATHHQAEKAPGSAQPVESVVQVAGTKTDYLKHVGVRLWKGVKGLCCVGSCPIQMSKTALSKRKVKNAKYIKLLYPENGGIFLGDLKDSDYEVARTLLADGTVAHAFILDVISKDTTWDSVALDLPAVPNLHIFKNYWEIAEKLRELNIISAGSLAYVKANMKARFEQLNAASGAAGFSAPNESEGWSSPAIKTVADNMKAALDA